MSEIFVLSLPEKIRGFRYRFNPEVDEGFGEPLGKVFVAFADAPELDEDAEKPRKNFQYKRPTSKGFSLTKFMNRN